MFFFTKKVNKKLLFLMLFLLSISTINSYAKKDLEKFFGLDDDDDDNNHSMSSVTILINQYQEKILENLQKETISIQFFTSKKIYDKYKDYIVLPENYYTNTSFSLEQARDIARNGLVVLDSMIGMELKNNPMTKKAWTDEEKKSPRYKNIEEKLTKVQEKINKLLTTSIGIPIPENTIEKGSLLERILENTIRHIDKTIRLNIIDNSLEKDFIKQNVAPVSNNINKILAINNKLILLLNNEDKDATNNQVTLMQWLRKPNSFGTTLPKDFLPTDIELKEESFQLATKNRLFNPIVAIDKDIEPLSKTKIAQDPNLTIMDMTAEHKVFSICFRLEQISHGLTAKKPLTSQVFQNPSYQKLLQKLMSFNKFFDTTMLGETDKDKFNEARKISKEFGNLFIFSRTTHDILGDHVNFETLHIDIPILPINFPIQIGNLLFTTVLDNNKNDITFLITNTIDQL